VSWRGEETETKAEVAISLEMERAQVVSWSKLNILVVSWSKLNILVDDDFSIKYFA
jgi:hypothetical protein